MLVTFPDVRAGKKLGDITMGGLRLISSGLSVDSRVLDRNGQWHCEKVGTVKGNEMFKKANLKLKCTIVARFTNTHSRLESFII